MVGWHHRLNGHGFGQTLVVGDGQGGLVCCSPRGHKDSYMTERLNGAKLKNPLCSVYTPNPQQPLILISPYLYLFQDVI